LNILLAFAPFAVFAILARATSPSTALLAAAITSVAILLRERFLLRRSWKVLEIGSALLFGGLGLYSAFAAAHWPLLAVRLYVDAGLLVIVLGSMVIRRPFTLQYAREETPREIWSAPEFVRANYLISGAWALAFAVMTGADVAMLYLTQIPLVFGIGVTVLALYGAVRFTSGYTAQAEKAGQTARTKV
jgi:hypothetical protein